MTRLEGLCAALARVSLALFIGVFNYRFLLSFRPASSLALFSNYLFIHIVNLLSLYILDCLAYLSVYLPICLYLSIFLFSPSMHAYHPASIVPTVSSPFPLYSLLLYPPLPVSTPLLLPNQLVPVTHVNQMLHATTCWCCSHATPHHHHDYHRHDVVAWTSHGAGFLAHRCCQLTSVRRIETKTRHWTD